MFQATSEQESTVTTNLEAPKSKSWHVFLKTVEDRAVKPK
ncbi:Glucan 1,3-beta-glucosidase [Venturia inaequalis]|nr:Glucan 1,3-beta-glucosidase [Venturia inaequalis]